MLSVCVRTRPGREIDAFCEVAQIQEKSQEGGFGFAQF